MQQQEHMLAMAIQTKWIKPLIATVGLLLSSCASAQDAGPEEGTYWSYDEKLFFVSSSGPTPLSVVGEEDFCLLFNRLRDPVIIDNREYLSGYGCGSFGTPNGLRWLASFDKQDTHSFTISLISKEKKLEDIVPEDLETYANLKLYRGCNGRCSKWPQPEFSRTPE